MSFLNLGWCDYNVHVFLPLTIKTLSKDVKRHPESLPSCYLFFFAKLRLSAQLTEP